ncbi:putative GPI-anchored protein [Acorus calamus]|uniref:GPI-anchored protein n=1 Tax=Acorus calamus TaxID=4465 RepID=A0AAV9E265_ACOCL|nr:putative GPI-anchored protein [Acorus calamus]
MRGGDRGPPPVLSLLRGLFLLLLLNEPNFHEVMGDKLHQSSIPLDEEKNLLPYISPSTSPRPFIPILAPSPSGENFPKLAGLCMLNISAVGSLMKMTAVDCWAFFAPFLANVICCPQLQATLVILIGQSSKETGMLSLTMTHANHCISDVQQILASQGANDDLQQICSIHPSNLTEASCPVMMLMLLRVLWTLQDCWQPARKLILLMNVARKYARMRFLKLQRKFLGKTVVCRT